VSAPRVLVVGTLFAQGLGGVQRHQRELLPHVPHADEGTQVHRSTLVPGERIPCSVLYTERPGVGIETGGVSQVVHVDLLADIRGPLQADGGIEAHRDAVVEVVVVAQAEEEGGPHVLARVHLAELREDRADPAGLRESSDTSKEQH